LTSSELLPVAPLMTDCMACCRAALSAATVAAAAFAADELVIVDMEMLRASVLMRD
jgi:hypothetical protein